MTQFTANEVRTESCKQGQLHQQPASDMLNAFADLLETREKAVPVAWRADWPGWRQYHDEMDPLPESWDDNAPEILPLYTNPQPAQDARRIQVWRQAFIDERARSYVVDGMKIEQARIHAETDAAHAEAAMAKESGR